TYFFNNGFFDVKTKNSIDSVGIKRGAITYSIETGDPYILDSITVNISSPSLDSLYAITSNQSYVKKGEQFNSSKFDQERSRITSYFRNNGVYNFQQNYINFDIDTIGTQKKPNVDLVIGDYSYRSGDTLLSKPFVVHKISEVNVFTDSPSSKSNVRITDSLTYNNYNFYSVEKQKFKPKAITDAIFISKDYVYADFRNTLTSRYISNLRVFNFPSIQYIQDPKDSTGTALIANIFLSPRKKYQFNIALDFTHSNIQDFGISGNTSLTIRNIFRGAETLEIAARGNIGSSRELANPDDAFFNLSEIGVDARLNFPRIFFPFNTEKIIPKSMIPSTQFSVGLAKQTNIGLDKENFTSFLTYNWNPKRQNNVRFDLFNIQYVKNLRIDRYFDVYRSSYNALNNLANDYRTPEIDDYFNEQGNLIIDAGTNSFLQDVLGQNPSIFPDATDLRAIRSIEERRQRLIENNLIVASSYSFSKSTKKGLLDNNFYIMRTKVELAGNTLSLLSRAV
ncbi:MAG: outer membrane protein assembly factor, partial [Flavobacterium sp.]